MTVLGIDNLTDEILAPLKGMRCALLCNQASVNREYVHSRFVLSEIPSLTLNNLFSPQHGFAAEKQDNMIESDHAVGRRCSPYRLYTVSPVARSTA